MSSGGPSARWGASGGIDIRVPFIQDPVVPGPNNTFYFAGGTDGTNIYPLSEVWKLHLSGTLSSNLPNSSSGSWDRVSIGSLPGRAGQGSTVIKQQVVAFGGCGTTQLNDTCALQDSFVLSVELGSDISPGPCPVPRLGPAVTPNLNPFSSSFTSQAFMVLGTFDKSRWRDDGGLEKGEVVRNFLRGPLSWLLMARFRIFWTSILVLGLGCYLPVTQAHRVWKHSPTRGKERPSFPTKWDWWATRGTLPPTLS